MKEYFVSYEIALLMKSMGFDEPCIGYWKTRDWLVEEKTRTDGYTHADQECSAPLKSQFFKWARDKKLTDASIDRHGTHDGGYSYRWDIVHEYGVYEERHFKLGYKTYEEAEDACINKIIELLKLK